MELICPNDCGTLRPGPSNHNSAYVCPLCGRAFPVDKGVVRLLERTDDFYEGTYKNQIKFTPRSETWYAAWPLWLINNGYLWAARKHIREGSTVLEIGCASGIAYFGKRFRMIGLDLSFSSLLGVIDIYGMCLQADARRAIPLQDQSVDAIFSSYVWEHIHPSEKPRVLEESYRVLRPGGKLIFLYDAESRNPLVRWMKRRDPVLYQRLFIENDGHLGYQTPDENRELFEKCGFSVLEHCGLERTWIQSPSVYEKLRHWDGWMRWLAEIGFRLGKPPWFQGYTALTRIVDRTVGRVFPTNWARVVISVCERQ
jgi:SAM-dependent methyltransferase